MSGYQARQRRRRRRDIERITNEVVAAHEALPPLVRNQAACEVAMLIRAHVTTDPRVTWEKKDRAHIWTKHIEGFPIDRSNPPERIQWHIYAKHFYNALDRLIDPRRRRSHVILSEREVMEATAASLWIFPDPL